MTDAQVQEAEIVEPTEEEVNDLVVRAETTLSLPTTEEWQSIEYAAHALSQSGIVPNAFRGRPADIIAAILTGRELGWGPMSALQRVHVIEGKPSLAAEAMVGLVRRSQHSITATESSAECCVVLGRRADNGDEMTVTWTIEMARRAGLASKNNWKNHTEAMLWARAVSKLCRQLFPDVLMGYTYTPDEVGEVIDAEVVEEPPKEIELPTPLQELRGTWTEQEIEDAANELRDALDPPLPPIKFIALAKSSPEALAKVKAKLESKAERSGDEWGEESAGSDSVLSPVSEPEGEAVRPDPASPSPQNACPECGHDCYPTDGGRAKWKCSECDWESWRNNPWKPGGEIEQLRAIRKLPQDDQDLIAHLSQASAVDVCSWVADLPMADTEKWQRAEVYGKNRKTVKAALAARLDQEPELGVAQAEGQVEGSGFAPSDEATKSEPHQEGLGVDVPTKGREPR